MGSLLLGLCLILLQLEQLYDVHLPPQRDLDLPVVLDTYDPSKQAPVPPTPEADDPRDEPPPFFFGEEIESENDSIYYVIDCSVSMSRYRRLERAQQELVRSIQGLSPNIRFNIVAYSCMLRSWRPRLHPATADNKASAIAWVNELVAGGGTGTGPAVALALADEDCMAVALLTDGAPSCGQEILEHRIMIRNNNHRGAPVNVFGIDARRLYREFCIGVAEDSGGSYRDVQ